jgi:hypothetical protein
MKTMKLDPYLKSKYLCMSRLFAIRGAMAIICAFAAMQAQGQTLIQDFEGFADSAALKAAIKNPTANSTVTLGATNGVNGSKALVFQGANGSLPHYSQFTLPANFSLTGVQSVTVAMKFIGGSSENLKIELLDSTSTTLAAGSANATQKISTAQFDTYTIKVASQNATVAGIRFTYGSSDYGTTTVVFDNISLVMNKETPVKSSPPATSGDK